MPSYNFLYGNEGFLTINLTGGTSHGRVLLRLTDWTLGTTRDVDETSTLDMPNYSVVSKPTTFKWTVSCTGIVATDTGEAEFGGSSSGDSRIHGAYNGLELLEVMKTKTSSAIVTLKLTPTNYQQGNVVLVNTTLGSQTGSKITYSVEMTGSGELVKLTS